MKKYLYFFGGEKADGNAQMRDLLGGKGAGLAEMTNIGISVPPGFTITTEVCAHFYKNNGKYPEGLWDEIKNGIKRLEEITKKGFGRRENPLLLSVRSGAAISMPGMMDTVLNIGLNDECVEGLSSLTKNPRFAYDSYRRLLSMFGSVVMGVEHKKFEEALSKKKEEVNVRFDTELDAEDLEEIVEEYKKIIKKETGEEFPQDVWIQLQKTIDAVFFSWNNPRAIKYREIHNIPHTLGTAVNVQVMVFGNLGENSGTGVGFTRDPATGEKVMYGEYLFNAQGEDVVAGIRTPFQLEEIKEKIPHIYNQLVEVYEKLERHYKDMQDIEFTVEEGKLYLLQTRRGERTAQAAVKIAVDMVKEGLISKEEAILRVKPATLSQLLHRRIDPKAKFSPLAKGLAASPGAASGKVVFTPDDAVRYKERGEKVILVREETSPDDIHGMAVAEGILTARGGMTSHAAVVARGMGKCCITGCSQIKVFEKEGYFTIDEERINKGDIITLDGNTGVVIKGSIPLIEPTLTEELKTFLEWADELRKLQVRANADTPEDARKAREFGAEGIGLCRTEHMFFAKERLPIMQSLILADNEQEREEALKALLPMQREDFIKIFEAMEGFPVTVRLLDPPLHEFLPSEESLKVEDEERRQKILTKIKTLREANPMLGHRGCRLGITFPSIYKMQVQAILEAASTLLLSGKKIYPEIMIPLVATSRELSIIKGYIDEIAKAVEKSYKVKVSYTVGTMIELPRACITADAIATEADFFSFGTNDLTQTTFGLSRDDAEGKFLAKYLEEGIFSENPFEVIDEEGVGELLKIGVQKGRSVKPHLKIGICGEHGGEPKSVEFCHRVGLDYVSCSPYRVPIARCAAAHAALKERMSDI